jgi:hypothetical protein
MYTLVQEGKQHAAQTFGSSVKSEGSSQTGLEFQFEPLGERTIKGKGLLSTFLVKVRVHGAGGRTN